MLVCGLCHAGNESVALYVDFIQSNSLNIIWESLRALDYLEKHRAING